MIAPLCRVAAFLAAVTLVCTSVRSQPPLPPPDKAEPKAEKPAEEPGVRVLEQGPVHEAFAQPGADVRGKGVTAPKAPPEPIPEAPPEAKPDGANVKWVPGYWMWDEERKDFIWVSGFWRNVPAGREWQPGKWTAAKDGTHAYTPGFWKPTAMNSWRIDLPEPPATVEAGPNTPPEGPDAVWIPGGWEFRNEQYVWRPGYWAKPVGDLLWTPGQYLTTTHGFTYVPGYWDYPLEERGLLYAPVCFTRPLWRTPGWAYRPRFAVGFGFGTGWGWGTGGLFTSLFIGPGFNNYYFGNFGRPWTGGTWLGLGFGSPFWGPVFGFGGPVLGLGGYANYIPWWATKRGFWNPLWRHYCWLNRGNPAYPKQVARAFVGPTFGVSTPPPPQIRNVAARPTVGGALNTAARSAANTAVNRPAPPARPVAAQPAAVGGALNTAARSVAATAARPPVPPKAAPLVQPAAQVANSIATAKAARAASAPKALSVAPPAGGVALGKAPAVSPPAAKLPTNPVHSGARIEPKMPTVVPGIQRPTLPDVRVPQEWPPRGSQPLVKSGGGTGPGTTVVPKTPVQIAPANPAPVTRGWTTGLPPVVRSNPAPSVPPARPAISLPPPQTTAPPVRLPVQSLPSIRPPAQPPAVRLPAQTLPSVQAPAARLPAQSLPTIRPPVSAPPSIRIAPPAGGRGPAALPSGGRVGPAALPGGAKGGKR